MQKNGMSETYSAGVKGVASTYVLCRLPFNLKRSEAGKMTERWRVTEMMERKSEKDLGIIMRT
jgi:hypothetical protein